MIEEKLFEPLKKQFGKLHPQLPLLFLIGLLRRLNHEHEMFMNSFYEYSGPMVERFVEDTELKIYQYLQGVQQNAKKV